MILLAASFATVLSCLIATSTEGKVVDARTGQPIAGAVITIAGVRGTASTAADGSFAWPELPPVPFTVVVVLRDGRAGRPLQVEHVESGGPLRIEVDVERSEAVTVRGTAPTIDVAPGSSTTSVASADIGLRHPATLARALENIPGVSAISEGQSATPAIRGLARGRTLVLVDGARVTAERGAGPSASFLDPATLAQVDVSRGPGSVAYGTDAFGGVIAAATRRPVASDSFGARVAATLGAGVPEQGIDLELAKGYGNGAVLVGARARTFDDYTSPEGEVPHSSWDDAGIRLLWDHEGAGGRWASGWESSAARDVHRPRSDSAVMVATSPFERSHRFTLSFARETVKSWRNVRADAFVGASEQRIEQERLPAPGRTRRIDRADSGADDFQVRLTGRRTAGPVRFHAGADLHGRRDLSSTDTAFVFNAADVLVSTSTTRSIESAHRTSFGFFTEGDVPVTGWMKLSGGIRAELSRSVNEGGFFGDRSIGHDDVAATGAVTVLPASSIAVTAQVARGFRDPTLTDRFAHSPVGRGFLEGNPDLVPETSRQFDVTARYRVGPIALGGAWYRYEIRNLIERYLAAPDLFRMRNRGRARLEGIEVDTRIQARGNLTIDLIGGASRGRDTTDGTPVDDVAPPSASVIARHAWRQRLWSYARVTAVSRHRKPGPSEVQAPGYTLLDLGGAVGLGAGVTLRAALRNALDASYYSSVGPRWVWAPGRQITVTLVLARQHGALR